MSSDQGVLISFRPSSGPGFCLAREFAIPLLAELGYESPVAGPYNAKELKTKIRNLKKTRAGAVDHTAFFISKLEQVVDQAVAADLAVIITSEPVESDVYGR